MKITKIRLKNGYKRFHDLTIDLGDRPKRIVALVGPNGCGKSSVLDGMLFHANAFAKIGNKDGKNHEYHSMNQTPNYDYQNVEIDFIEGRFRDVQAQRRAKGRENTIFSFRSPYRYNSHLKVVQSRATPEIRLNNYGATTSSDLDDKMEENYRRLYIKYNNYLNLEDCRPSEAKLKIIGDLNSSIRKCLDLEVASLGDIESSKGTLYFTKPDHSREFEFNVLSSGEKEVVDILVDLYLRKEEYDDSIFLLDEPELHINTSIQRMLIGEINRLVGVNCQIWVTTHSIGFLRALQDELKDDCQIIHFREGMNLASQVQTLTPVRTTVSEWREMLKVALDDLVHLLSPKKIVFCEGKDLPGKNGEERGLDASVYNRIFAEKYPDVLFVSSGGNTELDQRSSIALAILSKALPGVEILVLKDRDISSGKSTSLHDRQVYLENNPDYHRVLIRWEIENYLYDKEVLKRYCASNGLSFDEAGYDSFVTNIQDQNLKDSTGRIKNLCGITTNVGPEKFKLNLSTYISPGMTVFEELESCVFPR